MLQSQAIRSRTKEYNATVANAVMRCHLHSDRFALPFAIMLGFASPTKMSPCRPNCLTLLLVFPASMTTGPNREALVLLMLATAVVVTLAPPLLLCDALQLQDAALIDDVVMEAAEEWYNDKRNSHRIRTGATYPLSLPGSLAPIEAGVSRLRAGSLARHGFRGFGEFSVPPGVLVVTRRGDRAPDAHHVLAVRVNLRNLSAVYEDYAASSGGYRIASPVLGLMFYGIDAASAASLEVLATAETAILVNFSMAVPALQPGVVPLCMAVARNGSVAVTGVRVQGGSNVCHVLDQGHVALVLGGVGDGDGAADQEAVGEASKWKLALFGAALGAGGTVLLGLVLVALLSVRRRKSEMAEMERRAYEEEALRVSMVGLVRAPSASGSRTTPDELEGEYRATL